MDLRTFPWPENHKKAHGPQPGLRGARLQLRPGTLLGWQSFGEEREQIERREDVHLGQLSLVWSLIIGHFIGISVGMLIDTMGPRNGCFLMRILIFQRWFEMGVLIKHDNFPHDNYLWGDLDDQKMGISMGRSWGYSWYQRHQYDIYNNITSPRGNSIQDCIFVDKKTYPTPTNNNCLRWDEYQDGSRYPRYSRIHKDTSTYPFNGSQPLYLLAGMLQSTSSNAYVR